jgi:hypothetical protein
MSAEAKTVNPPKMTCAEFLALGEKIQPRAVAWLDGYNAAGKLKEQEVGDVDVVRQTDTLVVVCQQDPKVTFWDKVKAHLPGGSKKIKPTKMTCYEFVAMDDSVKPEAVFWSEGYNAGSEGGRHAGRPRARHQHGRHRLQAGAEGAVLDQGEEFLPSRELSGSGVHASSPVSRLRQRGGDGAPPST